MTSISPLQEEINEKVVQVEERFDEKAAEEKDQNNDESKSRRYIIENLTRFICMRLCLFAYSLTITLFIVCISKKTLYWLLIIPIFLILVDTLYICIARKGIEFDW